MSDDKTEQPTDKKLSDARDKGQVAMSRDLARVTMLIVVAELALATEPQWHAALDALFELALGQVGRPFHDAVPAMLGAAGTLLLGVFAVFFVVCPVVAFAAHWGQFGVLIAPGSLTPSIDKLNPVNGVKQLFAKKKLGELLMALAKAIGLALMIWAMVRKQLPSILQMASGEPKDIYFGFIALLRMVLHPVVGMCLVLAVIDFALQKYFHVKSLMMDMEEIKREYKESEGDPHVKQARKGLAQQWASESAPARTAGANAVVVNPTHFAVALFYDPGHTPAPLLLAKGKDEVAQAMIREARALAIPVIRHVWLARTLYATGKADHYVPRASYESVAQVYAVVQELMEQNDSGREVELESRGEPPPSHAP
ncbi:EscU/YscU/HrcU family type III secretion system export apparatus switch protein [Massilia sp. CCM 8733]|uniref:EscU/YscU/HrcU family type III secretion system export apparatus switch protein n=1 Tax=Massilia mucilaginosa TaxID=2609282 RepID=A0ABX0NW92_9BURK|nr:type III secretion system export apparatus subunit SctU [Massilia mucilaginosa]NHZ91132.1 EscU/YscU/HrcU family type III secretion system export apparatus switch protein [Massilia mucilaginosa]